MSHTPATGTSYKTLRGEEILLVFHDNVVIWGEGGYQQIMGVAKYFARGYFSPILAAPLHTTALAYKADEGLTYVILP